MRRFSLAFAICLIFVNMAWSQDAAQYRGPQRDGVYIESNLLKVWPENGPQQLWSVENLDNGFASPSVTNRAIYLVGRTDSVDYLTALDLQGKELWRVKAGRAAAKSFPESRCTPTVAGDQIYVITGGGDVACFNNQDGKLRWRVPALSKFKGVFGRWETSESPLLVDDKVIYTPGGPLTTMVALDRKTGKTVWQTGSIQDTTNYVSPILVETGGRKMIVNVLQNFIIGVDAEAGKLLWKVKYSDHLTDDPKTVTAKINCCSALYHDGHVFVTSGYDHVGLMLKLTDGGKGAEVAWVNADLDTHHGNVVRVGEYIYGSNWINNRNGNWCCVDWKSGKTLYEEKWHNKGSVVAADGLLYCYEEKDGWMGLVEPSPEGFKVISSFQITQGAGPHWSHPVIKNGVLYVRHGQALMAYKVGK